MHTTACETCRKARVRCERESRGHDQSEVCQRCRELDLECNTVKRRLGRQPGVKNKRRKTDGETGPLPTRDVGSPPNPLRELAQVTPRAEIQGVVDGYAISDIQQLGAVQDSGTIIDSFKQYADQLHGTLGRGLLQARLDALLAQRNGPPIVNEDQPSIFTGRTDMSRPDAMPEHDVISLQMISFEEAQRLYDLQVLSHVTAPLSQLIPRFLRYITNGSMYFDSRIHTLAFVRARSSFLLAVILAVATTYIPFNSNSRLHVHLMEHAVMLERHVRNSHFKSIEIVQGLLLLASWSDLPMTLSKDKTWQYISQAIALAIELRMDAKMPFCVQSDPAFESQGELLLRNSHRVCKLLLIHDRNMAMVSGRYPVYPETSLFSRANLANWGEDPLATVYDAPICASVSLRKLINDLQYRFAASKCDEFASDRTMIEKSMLDWRTRWADEIISTSEYDIIARFSMLVVALSLLSKKQYEGEMEKQARQLCETYAFEVCCASISHYKSWTGLLNSATFDTSMVAFCAMCTIQSIHQSPYDSDWALFRIATLQELVAELERQAGQRHPCRDPDGRTVVDAMAKQIDRAIRMVLNRPRRHVPATAGVGNDHDALIGLPDLDSLFQGPLHDSFDLQIPLFDDLSHLFGMGPVMQGGQEGDIPFDFGAGGVGEPGFTGINEQAAGPSGMQAFWT